jgi:hypothetical protein
LRPLIQGHQPDYIRAILDRRAQEQPGWRNLAEYPF